MEEVKKEENQAQEALRQIKENDWINVLKQCKSFKKRYEKLMDLLPETIHWDPISARKLVFYLHKQYGLDFGVCPFYIMEGDIQYCTVDGEKAECLCTIPEAYCVFRDKDGQPKYPELLTP